VVEAATITADWPTHVNMSSDLLAKVLDCTTEMQPLRSGVGSGMAEK
jgi:hypothetical protein